jgi:hypothetical protein
MVLQVKNLCFKTATRNPQVDKHGSGLFQLNAQMGPKTWALAELYTRSRAERLKMNTNRNQIHISC